MHSATASLNAALADRYRIERQVGAGGMATVYLAHDLKHDRRVALKVLKPELAAVLGADRFVVEIKTTASLQHPHILPLFDSGTADGFLYYVMPFIEGETLRDKLNRETQLGVEEAVRIARELADALDYAHRRGVIHRDIKPENILLHDGRAMVMDFGIAIAVSAAAGGRMTETGLSLGTPHYMSPEQATAEKDLTPRSDVYSLATVLYEMLAGAPPHVGGSAQQIIMRIITDPPRPVTELRRSVAPNVAAAVARALEKLPADRFESARAFAEALSDTGFTHRTLVGAATPALAAPPAPAGRRAVIAAAAVAVLATIAAVVGWIRPRDEPSVVRFNLSTADLVPLPAGDMVISPDGSTLAVTARSASGQAIYVRRLDGETQLQKVAGTDGATLPAFSPDSRWIVFRSSEGALVKVQVAGGGAVTLVSSRDTTNPYYSQWSSDDYVTYSSPTGTWRVPAAGGPPARLPNSRARTMFVLPDGSGLLTSSPEGVSLYDIRTDSSTVLIPGAAHPVYVETGHLLYVSQDNGLFAVPFDLRKHRIVGAPARVVERVASGNLARGYSVSRNGVLVVRGASGTATGGFTKFVIVTIGGGADTLRLPPARRLLPRFSPNGRALAYESMRSGNTGQTDIHTFDLVTGTSTQLTFEGDNDDPVWSPDGRTILFTRGVNPTVSNEDLFVKPVDNSGPERSLLSLPGDQNPWGWLADGTIVFVSRSGASWDLYTMPASGGEKPKVYLDSPWNEDHLFVSSDGKLATYTSNEDGQVAVWIRDFPVPQGKWRVATGSFPRWSPDGRHIYYWKSGIPFDTLFRVKIDRTPNPVVRSAEVILAAAAAGQVNWDIHPDGRRLVFTIDDAPAGSRGAGTGPEYLVVLNWFRELQGSTAKAGR